MGFKPSGDGKRQRSTPDDERNIESANALEAMGAALSRLPVSHPAWQALFESWEKDGDVGSTQNEEEFLRNYGFNDPACKTPEEFLAAMVDCHDRE